MHVCSLSLQRFTRAALAVVVLSVVSISALYTPPALAQDQNREVIDQIVAVVGDDIVLKSEVDQLLAGMMQQQQSVTYSKDLWMQALNELIDQRVLAEQAERDTTITVSPAQLETQLDLRLEQIERQAGGEDEVKKIYGKSVIELKEQFRGEFREQLLAEQFRSRKLQNVRVTPSEVRQWFQRIPSDSLPRLPETVRIAHIVRYPKLSEEAKNEAREIISAIRDSIVSGTSSFEDMAQRFSDDPGSASSGGRIQGLAIGDFVPEFAAVASRTPVGDISQVFYNSTQKGYHILRVNERSGSQVDLNHILVRVDQSEADPTETIEYLSAVRDTLQERDIPFELMARRHSEEPRSADNGGRVTDPRSGTRDLVLSALGPSWQASINSIEEGAISEPTNVRLLDGDQAYHIVLLQDRKPPHRVNLNDDYERIRQYALQEKQQRVFREWMDELREDVYVDVRITRDELASSWDAMTLR